MRKELGLKEDQANEISRLEAIIRQERSIVLNAMCAVNAAMSSHTTNEPDDEEDSLQTFHCSSDGMFDDDQGPILPATSLILKDKYRHRINDNRPHICHVCTRGFSRSDHLNEHMETHNANKKHKCHLCNYSSDRKRNVVPHIKLIHKEHNNAT